MGWTTTVVGDIRHRPGSTTAQYSKNLDGFLMVPPRTCFVVCDYRSVVAQSIKVDIDALVLTIQLSEILFVDHEEFLEATELFRDHGYTVKVQE